MLKNAMAIGMMVFTGACSAADDIPHGYGAGGGGGVGGASGTGGISDAGGAGWGTGGSGGADYSETLSAGVVLVAHSQDDIIDLLCQNSSVYLVGKQSRSVVRIDPNNGESTKVLTVGGDGDISIGDAGENLLVSVSGRFGRVSINSTADGSEIDASEVAGLTLAAFGNGRMYWAQGSGIYTGDGLTVASSVPVSDLAIDQEGPVWLGADGHVYRLTNGTARTVGPVVDGAYPGTLVLFGATAVLGTNNGAKMLLFSGGQAMSWGSNVVAVSKTRGALAYCDSSENAANLYVIKPAEVPEFVAAHTTCNHVAVCDDYVYWTTNKNNVLRAALPSR